jgi:hypothetical protein
MFDIFTEEIDKLIKEGISNFRWYRGDLKKILLQSKINPSLCDNLFSLEDENGQKLSKRKIMDKLYEELRTIDFNRRLEISRNLARVLLEATEFNQESPDHKVVIAQNCALKLKEIKQKQEQESFRKQKVQKNNESPSYTKQMEEFAIKFNKALALPSQQRGYELEKLFPELMRISKITVHEPFKIIGEQIDGAIKYDGHFYLIELKWQKEKVNQPDVASLYLKVEGKIDGTRGIFISMNGYSNEMLKNLPQGKKIQIFLLDGMHLTDVIYQHYSFKQLLEHAISEASLKGCIFCNRQVSTYS